MIWLALALGGVVGFGVILLVAELLPRQPKMAAALENLGNIELEGHTPTVQDSLSRFMQQGWLSGLRVEPRDLALVETSPVEHHARQAMMGIAGLAIPPILGLVVVTALQLPAPAIVFSIPVSIGLAALLIYAINLTVTQRATEAREEFARAVATYIELVAAARKRNTSAAESLKKAADVADSWVFRRLQQELQMAQYKNMRPWEAFKRFSKEIGVPELSDLADIMKLAGSEGVSVYEPLRARGRGLRVQLLNDARTKANADSERITMPMALMGLIFMALIAVPPLFRLIGST